MNRHAFLPALLLLAGGCSEAGEDAPARTPHQLVCPGPVVVDAFVLEEGSAVLTCDVEWGTAERPLALIGVEAEGPFSATLIGAGEGGGPLVEVKYRPIEGGTHQGLLRVHYGSAGRVFVAESALEGKAQDLPAFWDDEPLPGLCRAEGEAPLLDQALALTGLNRDTFTWNVDLKAIEILDDPFRLSWFDELRASPARAGCFEGQVAGGIDHAVRQQHKVAGAIRQAAALLDRIPDYGEPLRRGSFDEALAALCAQTSCEEATGELPADLRYALAPILFAITEGLEARAQMDAELTDTAPAFWHLSGGNHNLGSRPVPDALDEESRAYLLGENGRKALYRAAAKIAFAVENAPWFRFEGREGIRFDLRTGAGWIRVRDAAGETYADDGEAQLLFLDLGGDDVHLDPIAANRSAENAVSLAIDLAGDDRYGYEPVANPNDREGLLPSDEGGRSRAGASASHVSRQGGARNGIAMLFDLGLGSDRYESLRASQGYAHLGVGVLYDGGGNDVYLGEALVQGAAQFGIGLAIDDGSGADEYTAFSLAQGFGYVGGAGFLFDGGGPDRYRCDNGDPAHGGIPGVYPSPQLPETGNTSMCQGAGFGLRQDARELFLSGGLGVLRDRDGDDVYEASVFAQGTGYWQGTGLLSDGAGADTYDAFWYVQGGAAHFAVGILADGGPLGDVFSGRLPTRNMSHGAGHDFSTGVLINDQGDDVYHFGTLAGGASNCNGMGLFVDNAGDDTYVASSDYGSGMGNVSGECIDTRPEPVSIGVMIDAGGSDTYDYPASSFPIPSDGGTWGHARNDLSSEHGAGLDAEGESGVHPETLL
ncbi:hypothetical protein [Vulgatibacter sp.]|uniref:hypothetical protein n=1 Tax=Vulgatibacter sp. TaxID=1971226 RepID=UPI00356265E3